MFDSPSRSGVWSCAIQNALLIVPTIGPWPSHRCALTQMPTCLHKCNMLGIQNGAANVRLPRLSRHSKTKGWESSSSLIVVRHQEPIAKQLATHTNICWLSCQWWDDELQAWYKASKCRRLSRVGKRSVCVQRAGGEWEVRGSVLVGGS